MRDVARTRVVGVVLVRRYEIAVAARPCLLVGLGEHDELELGADHRGPSVLGQPCKLPAQHLAGRRADGSAVLPDDIGEQQRGAFVPRDEPQRAEVRLEDEVAVSAFPGSELVALDRVHVDVDGEQVVARLGTVLEHLVEEVAGVEPLALQPSLHVGEAEDDGVDLVVLDVGPQLVDRQKPSPLHPGTVVKSVSCPTERRVHAATLRQDPGQLSLMCMACWGCSASSSPRSRRSMARPCSIS